MNTTIQKFISSNNGAFRSKYDFRKVEQNEQIQVFSSSVTFSNKGEATAVINGIYELRAGENLTLGGIVENIVDDTFNVEFAEVLDAKKVFVISEYIVKQPNF